MQNARPHSGYQNLVTPSGVELEASSINFKSFVDENDEYSALSVLFTSLFGVIDYVYTDPA